ncbi:hypothetical protein, partial [Parabacteroides goldsteinii]|uniref:hypothetical protein n=1 Tax=Parabacteroides goldsteinii TaxID=328812 RepID=UPI0025A506C2
NGMVEARADNYKLPENEWEMSRFRKYRTPVNQGFPATAQRVCGTFILYPRKSRFKCVTEAADRR